MLRFGPYWEKVLLSFNKVADPAETKIAAIHCYKNKNEPSNMLYAAIGPVRINFIGGGGGSRTRVRNFLEKI